MRYLTYGSLGFAIVLLTAIPFSKSLACGMCSSSDNATAGFSGFGWIHLACCGAIVVVGIILLVFQKLGGRGKG